MKPYSKYSFITSIKNKLIILKGENIYAQVKKSPFTLKSP